MRQKIINALWQMVYHHQLAVPSKEFFDCNIEIDGNDSLELGTLAANLENRLADEGLKIVEEAIDAVSSHKAGCICLECCPSAIPYAAPSPGEQNK